MVPETPEERTMPRKRGFGSVPIMLFGQAGCRQWP